MDLDFGHGFIPRIASQNYKAVDRCLGPDTLLDAPLDLPWAIVDAPWAEKNQDFLASLRAHGTKVLLDGSCWRYRYGPTFDVGTMAKASSPSRDRRPRRCGHASVARLWHRRSRCRPRVWRDVRVIQRPPTEATEGPRD